MEKKIAVIGGGSFGTALAALAADNGGITELFLREENIIEAINTKNENPTFLPNIKLPTTLTAKKMDEITKSDSNYFIWAIPSQYTREIAKKYAKTLTEKHILIATKGIEISTGELILNVMKSEVNAKYSVLSGPSFAKELAVKKPTTVSIASNLIELAKWWQKRLSTEYFRVYTSDDMIGLEVGGAIKNVIAIAAGLSDGLGFDNNARAAIITRGLVEITRFGLAYGGKRETFVGLSGLGDLVLTCSGGFSRNHQVGMKLATGISIDEITSNMNMIAEGVPTSKAIYHAALERGVDMPISTEVYKIIYENKSPLESSKDLMVRPLKVEAFY